MKKFLTFGCLLVALVVSGCSAEEVSSLTAENSDLKVQVSSLQSELDEIKNGPSYIIQEIRSAFEQEDYDKVKTLSSELHEKANGSDEDIEAQGYLSQVTDIEEQKQKEKEEAERKAAEEAAKSKQDKLREIIRVKSVKTSKPNSAGGVDLYIDWVNNSEKTIKYTTFTVEPYNAVDDIVQDTIRWDSTFRGKTTGPIEKGEGSKKGYYWECAWYNYSITYAQITKIEIEYSDGTTATINSDDIQYVVY